MASEFVVAKARDLPDGSRMIVEAGGRSIGVFNVRGRFYALLNRCPHQGAELCRGAVFGLVESDRPGDVRLNPAAPYISCPWHGWEYDLATGESWFNPDRTRVRPYPVRVEGGAMVADALARGEAGAGRTRGPYVAEVIPIRVEDDYVVVSLPARSRP